MFFLKYKLWSLIHLSLLICTKSSLDEDFSEFDGDEFLETAVPEKAHAQETKLVPEVIPETVSTNYASSDTSHDQFNFPDEEFEVITEALVNEPEIAIKKEVKPIQDLKIAVVHPDHYTRSWNNYHLELIVMIGLVIYMLNFIHGKNKNAKIASAWFLTHKDLLESNFAIIGDDGVNQPPTNTLLKEHEHVFSIWCSGRLSVEGMLVEIKLLNRQCLVGNVLRLFKPNHDSIVVRVFLEDTEMDTWVMAIARKRKIGQLLKDYPDLTNFISDKRGARHPSLPESFLVLNEITEATTAALSPTVCKLLTTYENSIDYIHLSDQYVGPKNRLEDPSSTQTAPQVKKVLTFAFRIGPMDKEKSEEEVMESMKPLMQMVIYMIDKVPRIRLTKMAKAKAEASRRTIQELKNKSQHLQRQEAAQIRKDEKRRAVKERILAEEDPDRARRMEEREQKREKKKSSKMKMIKVKGM